MNVYHQDRNTTSVTSYETDQCQCNMSVSAKVKPPNVDVCGQNIQNLYFRAYQEYRWSQRLLAI